MQQRMTSTWNSSTAKLQFDQTCNRWIKVLSEESWSSEVKYNHCKLILIELMRCLEMNIIASKGWKGYETGMGVYNLITIAHPLQLYKVFFNVSNVKSYKSRIASDEKLMYDIMVVLDADE